jgi:hypothetical protein
VSEAEAEADAHELTLRLMRDEKMREMRERER